MPPDRQTNRQIWGKGVGCSLTLQLADKWGEALRSRHTDRQGGVQLATVQKLHIWKQLEQMGTQAGVFL